MIIYNAFHSIGLFSVFDSDALSNADIYTGAFLQVRRKISSVMDVKTRNGNMKGQKLKLVQAHLVQKPMEGPLKPVDGKEGCYLVSMKHSYLEKRLSICTHTLTEAFTI